MGKTRSAQFPPLPKMPEWVKGQFQQAQYYQVYTSNEMPVSTGMNFDTHVTNSNTYVTVCCGQNTTPQLHVKHTMCKICSQHYWERTPTLFRKAVSWETEAIKTDKTTKRKAYDGPNTINYTDIRTVQVEGTHIPVPQWVGQTTGSSMGSYTVDGVPPWRAEFDGQYVFEQYPTADLVSVSTFNTSGPRFWGVWTGQMFTKIEQGALRLPRENLTVYTKRPGMKIRPTILLSSSMGF